jgi:hypothetical protein
VLDEMVSLRREDFESQDGFLGNQGRDQPRDVEDHHTQEELPVRGYESPLADSHLEPENTPNYNELSHLSAEG